MIFRLLVCAFFLSQSSFADGKGTQGPNGPRPKLILLVAVDQMRSDYLTRFRSRFLPSSGAKLGGFRYFTDRGAYIPQASFGLLQCMTGPGHATMMTGSYPHATGIPLNEWFDAKTKKRTYCVSDESMPLVGATGPGVSPRNLRTTTVGDELKNAGYPSRLASVALKDRAAVLMAGHRADTVLWFDSGKWVSSRYYWKDGNAPAWVTALNGKASKRFASPYKWEKTAGAATGLSMPTLGADGAALQFPIQYEASSKEALATPLGVELTVDAALAMADAMNLGKGAATDVLTVSFSSHDYLGHKFGPNSNLMEEMTVAEDRELARLLAGIASRVPGGMQNVVTILTADHGIPPDSDWLKSTGIDAGRVNEKALAQGLEERLRKKFGGGSRNRAYLSFVDDMDFWFDSATIGERNVSPSAVYAEAHAYLAAQEGIAHVITRGDWDQRKLPAGTLGERYARTFVEGRSPDVVAVPMPFYSPMQQGVTHITGYSYDDLVPLAFVGRGFRAGVYAEGKIADIAPTLSFLLGIVPPPTSEGRVLEKLLE